MKPDETYIVHSWIEDENGKRLTCSYGPLSEANADALVARFGARKPTENGSLVTHETKRLIAVEVA